MENKETASKKIPKKYSKVVKDRFGNKYVVLDTYKLFADLGKAWDIKYKDKSFNEMMDDFPKSK